ncbi:hypothetical protein C8R45DRAFT_1091513 [Mycena sanguinolenta]|nr:hypothetical protein C8R45DRAFT_1091513 [Mycena sanguinolenta]
MSDAPVPSLEPTGITDDQGNYVLQTRDMFNLLKFLWTGVLLCEDQASYCTRTGISSVHYTKASSSRQLYKTQLDPLLDAYKGVSAQITSAPPSLSAALQLKGHCTTFKNDTYPAIVGIADSIYNYADQASGGGDISASYYAFIFDNIRSLAAATTQADKDTYKATIKEAIDAMVATIGELKTSATGVTDKLKAFELECRADQAKLTTCATAVSQQLSGATGAIATLQATIKKNQQALADDKARAEHDKLILATSAAYAWCGPIGAIVALGVDIKFGLDLKAMESAISQLNSDLKSENQELQDDKAIVAELGNVKLDIQNVIDLIGPAVAAIDKMIGVWDAIGTAHDLGTIQTFVDNNVRKVSGVFTTLVGNSVIHKWTDLRNAVDKYRQVAYVSDMPAVTTLDEYSKALTAKVAASS